jgi:hypothetical protein
VIRSFLRNHLPEAILTLLFIFSRLLVHVLGVRFYGSFIHRMWQSIDLELLRTRLGESLFYSHAQPPLFNFINGIIVKLAPASYYTVFHALTIVLSLATCLLIFHSLRALNVSRILSVAGSAFYILSPAVILYENIYSYTMLTVFALTVVIFLLIRLKDFHTTASWIAFCMACTFLVLTRSMFHLIWLAAAIGIGWTITKKFNTRYVVVALFAMAIALSWYVKNQILFGTFSSSSWLGMNIARLYPTQTQLGIVGPFKSLDSYNEAVRGDNPYAHIAVLANSHKSQGYTNFNHYQYLKISEEFKQEVIQNFNLNQYAGGVCRSFVIYFNPVTHAPFVDKNFALIRPFSRLVTLDLSSWTNFERNGYTVTRALPAFMVYLLFLILTCTLFYRNIWFKSDRFIVLFLWFIIAYGMLVGNLLEYGENNRFRFEGHTAFLILAVVSIDRIFRRFQNTYLQKRSM